MKLILVLILLIEATSSMATATVGGPRIAEILGYDPVDRKLYYTYEWRDESGRPPQLYYLSLGSSKPEQAVEVKSWYKDQGTPL
jgi:hypothetical protein